MPLLGLETVSRTDPVYKACLTVATGGGAIVGGATGSFLGPAGSVAGYLGGAAWGFSAGFLVCPYLAPGIKQKLQLGQFMTDREVRSAAQSMGRYAGVSEARDALQLLAMTRSLAARSGGGHACVNPSSVARELLNS